MRKRLNGVYRADSGFSGPTRRYVLIVALLVGLASVPTLAAITAGSNQLADGKTDTMDIPFLPPASPGPVRTRPRLSPAPPSSPSSPPPGPSLVPPPAPGAAATDRWAGKKARKTAPARGAAGYAPGPGR